MSFRCIDWQSEEQLALTLSAALNSDQLPEDSSTRPTAKLVLKTGSRTTLNRKSRDELRLRLDRALSKVFPRPDLKQHLLSSNAKGGGESALINEVAGVVEISLHPFGYPIYSVCGQPGPTKSIKKSGEVECYDAKEVKQRRKEYQGKQAGGADGFKKNSKLSKICATLLCSTSWLDAKVTATSTNSAGSSTTTTSSMKRITSMLPQPQYTELPDVVAMRQHLLKAAVNRKSGSGGLLFTAGRGIELELAIVGFQDIYCYLALKTTVDGEYLLCGRIHTPVDLSEERSKSRRKRYTAAVPPTQLLIEGGASNLKSHPLFLGAKGPISWVADLSSGVRILQGMCQRFLWKPASNTATGVKVDWLELLDVCCTSTEQGDASAVGGDTVATVLEFVVEEALSTNNKWAASEAEAFAAQKRLHKRQAKESTDEVEDDATAAAALAEAHNQDEHVLAEVKAVRWLLQCMGNNQDVLFTGAAAASLNAASAAVAGRNSAPASAPVPRAAHHQLAGFKCSVWNPKDLCPKPITLGTVLEEDESSTFEYKQALIHEASHMAASSSSGVERIRQTIAAMASTQGGLIAVGVTDAGFLVGAATGLKGTVRTTGFYPALQSQHVQVHDISCRPAADSAGSGATGGSSVGETKLAKDWWKTSAKKTATATPTVVTTSSKVVTFLTVESGSAPFYTTGKLGSSVTQWPMVRGFASTMPLSVHAVQERIVRALTQEGSHLSSATLVGQGIGSTLNDLEHAAPEGLEYLGGDVMSCGRSSTSSQQQQLEDGSKASTRSLGSSNSSVNARKGEAAVVPVSRQKRNR